MWHLNGRTRSAQREVGKSTLSSSSARRKERKVRFTVALSLLMSVLSPPLISPDRRERLFAASLFRHSDKEGGEEGAVRIGDRRDHTLRGEMGGCALRVNRAALITALLQARCTLKRGSKRWALGCVIPRPGWLLPRGRFHAT